MATYAIQVGTDDGIVSGGLWDDTTLGISLSTATDNVAGLRYTTANGDTIWDSASLRFTPTTGIPFSGNLTVNVVGVLDSDPWSNSRLPNTLADEIQVASQAVTNPGLGSTFDVALDVDLLAPYQRGNAPTVTDPLAEPPANLAVLAFSLVWDSAFLFTVGSFEFGTAVQLVTSERDAFTGLSGAGTWPGASSRADRCPRSGIRMLREDMVRDGYTDRFVHPEWWEPPILEPEPLDLKPKREQPPVNED